MVESRGVVSQRDQGLGLIGFTGFEGFTGLIGFKGSNGYHKGLL